MPESRELELYRLRTEPWTLPSFSFVNGGERESSEWTGFGSMMQGAVSVQNRFGIRFSRSRTFSWLQDELASVRRWSRPTQRNLHCKYPAVDHFHSFGSFLYLILVVLFLLFPVKQVSEFLLPCSITFRTVAELLLTLSSERSRWGHFLIDRASIF